MSLHKTSSLTYYNYILDTGSELQAAKRVSFYVYSRQCKSQANQLSKRAAQPPCWFSNSNTIFKRFAHLFKLLWPRKSNANSLIISLLITSIPKRKFYILAKNSHYIIIIKRKLILVRIYLPPKFG